MKRECPDYRPVADYALIGDCHTAALVSRAGSVDWYCPGRFDAPSLFGGLLDADKGGRYLVTPAGAFMSQRRYVRDSNVLETLHTAGEVQVRVTDFMPMRGPGAYGDTRESGSAGSILRLVEGLRGSMKMDIEFDPRFDYAQGDTRPGVRDGTAFAAAGERSVALGVAGGPLAFDHMAGGGLHASLTVQTGSRHWLVLTSLDEADRYAGLLSSDECERRLDDTLRFWEGWATQCTYEGPYDSEVVRSALTLKMLSHAPTGAIIAAPTTSLPEELGGERNWDYRYGWTRDSTMILSALMGIGYREEAAAFFEWLQEAHHHDRDRGIQVLYAVDGRREATEKELRHWRGYCDSRPVRIGNAAAGQTQLDIYGEVLAAADLYFSSKMGHRSQDPGLSSGRERLLQEDWPLIAGAVDQAAKRWDRPDNGIWEVRGGKKRFVYSRLMCWVALDRGIGLAEAYGLDAPLPRWKKARRSAGESVLEDGFDRGLGSFVQVFGTKDVDATALLIPRTGLLDGADPRMLSTIETVRQQLGEEGLLYRYRSVDGLKGGEAAFATCTFWLVDALARAGRHDEAHELFAKLAGYSNDVGLLSEEIDPSDGSLVGNFPQGFSHMALINSALALGQPW